MVKFTIEVSDEFAVFITTYARQHKVPVGFLIEMMCEECIERVLEEIVNEKPKEIS